MKRAGDARGLSLFSDDRLARLAFWFATVTQRIGGSPPLEAIDFATRHLGMIEPLPALLVTVERDGRWEPPLDSLFEHAPRNIRYNRVGVAVLAFGSTRVAGIALASAHVEASPVPRSLPVGAESWFEGELEKGYQHPELAMTLPDGSTERVSLGTRRAFRTKLSFADAGRTQIEILATGPSGLEVLANFPVYVGESPPKTASLTRGVSETAAAAVASLGEMLNAERQKNGLTKLVFDARLSEVAARHSADMAEQRFFGHESPTHGDPVRRARRAGLSIKQLGENVGRGPSARDLHHLLMGSPGHRANILKPEFTHVGIGVVADDSVGERVLLATQLFATAPRPLPPSQFNSKLLALVNQSRSRNRVSPLELDAELERLACAGATGSHSMLAASAKSGDALRSADFEAFVHAAQDPEDAAREPALYAPTARRVGLCSTPEQSVMAARTVVIVVSASVYPRAVLTSTE